MNGEIRVTPDEYQPFPSTTRRLARMSTEDYGREWDATWRRFEILIDLASEQSEGQRGLLAEAIGQAAAYLRWLQENAPAALHPTLSTQE